ncbi:hypothetical protein FRB99_001225 [Tulasnella sp. 403]|nr:hypothetical protein FRB99_001225 [Tulasnella sp. 403]
MFSVYNVTVLLAIAGGITSAMPLGASSPCMHEDKTEPFELNLQSLSESSTPLTLNARYLTHGNCGCVYEVVGGFENPFKPGTGLVDALLKTPRLDRAKQMFKYVEVKALRDRENLFFNGVASNGYQWMVIEKLEGVHAWDHPEFRSQFPLGYLDLSGLSPDSKEFKDKTKECEATLKQWTTRVVAAFEESVMTYGWDNQDTNWDNFLFTLDNPPKVNLIDWGDAWKVEGDTAARAKHWEDNGKNLSELLFQKDSSIPPRDNDLYQGVCQSTRRDKGEPYKSPVTVN